MSLIDTVKTFSSAIKISHSIFALPFALAAAFMAAEGLPDGLLLVKVVIACVAARTAAMSFNRLVDARLDARNPRTAMREVPSGRLSKTVMGVATAVSTVVFVLVAWWINTLAGALSPVALAVLLGYSYTKRFTSLSHVVLGAALGLAPLGAWIAVTAGLTPVPVLLGLAVLLWTAGFDVIYSCQDCGFDRTEGLHSIPARLGIARALWCSRGFHVATVALLAAVGWLAGYGVWYTAGVVIVAALLVWEHGLVKPDDLSRVNVAFFTLNGVVSLVFMAAVIVEVVS